MPVPENPNPVIDELSQELDAISGRLVAARVNAEALSGFPGRLPETLEDAYAIQTASIARWPEEDAGWKVGMVPVPYRPHFSADRIAGPIFKASVFTIESEGTKTMPVFGGGFAAVEAEFILQLAATLEPKSRDYTDEELTELVSAMYVGVEVASSPMAAINELGPCCIISDFGNNAGLLVGPEISDWSSRPLDSLTAKVAIDDIVVGEASASSITGGPLQALRFLIGLCANRGMVIPKGTLVSTGAATGVHDMGVNSKARVDFGAFGWFDVAFESMSPKQ